MKIIKDLPKLARWVKTTKRQGRRIGFVPTMGALHEGHLSLIRKARKENDRVVVSLFVNPIQFDQKKDLRSYPRTDRQDARLAAGAGADLLFAPSPSAIYPPGFQTFVEIARLSRPLEGRFRPGHFRGVATVVTKLFNLVQPDCAYFGQKDAQQARIVQQLIQDLNFPTRLRILPTIRERDGLAMSSRNRRLSTEARRSSRALFVALQEARRLIQSNVRRSDLVGRRIRQMIRQQPGTRIDYVAIVDPETLQPVRRIRKSAWILLAVWVGGVRLIDGCVVS